MGMGSDKTLSEQARALADAHRNVWFVEPFDKMRLLLRALADENDRLRAQVRAQDATIYRMSAELGELDAEGDRP